MIENPHPRHAVVFARTYRSAGPHYTLEVKTAIDKRWVGDPTAQGRRLDALHGPDQVYAVALVNLRPDEVGPYQVLVKHWPWLRSSLQDELAKHLGPNTRVPDLARPNAVQLPSTTATSMLMTLDLDSEAFFKAITGKPMTMTPKKETRYLHADRAVKNHGYLAVRDKSDHGAFIGVTVTITNPLFPDLQGRDVGVFLNPQQAEHLAEKLLTFAKGNQTPRLIEER